ncbi:MAG: hypothetical protein C4343_05700, partial [Chloroflexota bacterium]
GEEREEEAGDGGQEPSPDRGTVREAGIPGDRPGERRGEGTDKEKREDGGDRRRPQDGEAGDLDERGEWHPVTEGRDRERRLGGDPAADLGEDPDEVDARAPAVGDGPGGVHVVGGVGIRWVRESAGRDDPGEEGQEVQDDRGTHGRCSVAPARRPPNQYLSPSPPVPSRERLGTREAGGIPVVTSGLLSHRVRAALARRRRPLTDGLVLAGLAFAAYLFAIVAPRVGTVGFDAFAYWAVDPANPYQRTAGALGAFTYSPVVARLFAPVRVLDFWQFLWLWEGVLIGTLIWLGGRRSLSLLAVPPVALELYHGNVHLLIGAAVVLGFRYPGAWAFILLTKVTPGVGLLWFAVRREWRALATAIGVTLSLVALSWVVDGRLWLRWVSDSLFATAAGAPLNQFSIPIPLSLRLPAAAAIVIWGARTSRPWTVPAAVTLALPVLWPSGFAVLGALWGMARSPGSGIANRPRSPGS